MCCILYRMWQFLFFEIIIMVYVQRQLERIFNKLQNTAFFKTELFGQFCKDI